MWPTGWPPRNLTEAARVAQAVGNLHWDFVVNGEVLLVFCDAPVELLLTRLGVSFERQPSPLPAALTLSAVS
ncbi:hypothetical protein GCM10022631_05720 [Deinococcus rubellus]|uniref:Uncharacterized protein n=1 Tax=Deinococcus rubellus TaxID=1889240 RepID=A0ABY5YH13_9DEIO|nr:hypothetical protein [Deinococcus rubellus]UWX64078.1 hypothetical protein N0D28_15415 [Deinococcus rubellus]